MNWTFSMYDTTWRPTMFFLKEKAGVNSSSWFHTPSWQFISRSLPHIQIINPLVEALTYTPQFSHPIQKCMKWNNTVEN